MSTSLKDLQQTLADGAEGFTKAAETVSNPELKVLFEAFAAERREMADELAAFSSADPEDETPSVAGALHRGWINLKSALTSGDDHAILAECERGEDHAVAVFQKAPREADFPAKSDPPQTRRAKAYDSAIARAVLILRQFLLCSAAGPLRLPPVLRLRRYTFQASQM